MARSTDKTYTEVVTVALSPGQKEKLDARVKSGTNRSDIIRAALDAYLDGAISDSASPGITVEDVEQAVERVLARRAEALSDSGSTGSPAPAAKPAPARKQRTTQTRAKLQPVEADDAQTSIMDGVVFSGDSARLSRLMARVEASTQEGTED